MIQKKLKLLKTKLSFRSRDFCGTLLKFNLRKAK